MSAITTSGREGPLGRLAGQVHRVDLHTLARVGGLVVGWISVLWLLVWLALSMAANNPAYDAPAAAEQFKPETNPLWQYAWARWDGQWYISIAYGGYGFTP